MYHVSYFKQCNGDPYKKKYKLRRVKTITMLVTKDKCNSMLYIYDISFGNRKKAVISINRKFNEESLQLQSITEFYVSKEAKYLPCIVRVMAMSADNPKRCWWINILNHSSRSTKKIYSSLVNAYKLASCYKCDWVRVQQMYGELSNRRHRRCGTWSDFEYLKLQ